VLRLRRIEINGFKSFYDKANIDFPGRIIGVVGPNGCGKSNICDAITWVLGEQSAKSLRSERMDDVIFNGSARRKPLGLAEVSIVLTSENSELGEAAHEITLTRRVYRDGEGEYRINGKKARLRDIHDMLMDTGLGIKDYSVIQQGKIDLILSTRPQDRRRLIEEAAGITKYKARKRAAEMKLEETTLNLQRIQDLLAELERQCNSLKRQAGRAERWRETEAKLIVAREKLYAWGYRTQQARLADLSARHESHVGAEGEWAARLGSAEATVASARHALDEDTARVGIHREEAGALRGGIATKEETFRSAERRIADAGEREVVLAGRDEVLTGEEARFSQAAEEAGRALEAERTRLEALRNDLDLAERERRDADVAARTCEQEIESLRKELLGLIGRSGEERNRAHSVEIAAERARFQAQKLGEVSERLEEIRTARIATLEILAVKDADLSSQLAGLTAEIEASGAEKKNLESEESQLREEVSRAKNSAWAAEHKIESLSLLVARKEKPFRDQAEALASVGGIAAGLFADHLEAEPGSEALLDAALGDLADAPVIRDGGAAADILVRARAERGNALRFVAADHSIDMAALAGAFGRDEIADAGGIPLSTRLRPKGDAPAGAAALLADCWLVPDLALAASLSRRFPNGTFFTPDRFRIRGCVFEAPGQAPLEGPLTLRREIHDLEIKRDEEHVRAEGLARNVEQTSEKIASAALLLTELTSRRTALDSERALVAADRRRSDDERAQAEREMDVYRRERTVYLEELGRLEGEKSDLARRLEISTLREAELGAAITGRSADLVSLREDLGPKAARAATLRTDNGVASERVQALERESAATAERAATARTQRADVARERASLTETKAEAASDRESTLYALRDDLLDLDRLADLILEEEEALSSGRSELEAREAGLQQDRLKLDEVRAERHQIEVDLASDRANLDHLVESCGRDLHRIPSELPDPGEMVEGELDAVRAEVESFAQSLEKMGVVNLLALEEFKETDERRNFLKTQHDDLVNSIASLRETIKKINETSSERFTEAFRVVNANFSAMFQELFHGGMAQMRLIDETDPLESGIEITAKPPGKNNQSILLLSGGEKALTAIALLMAIFKFKPSPFCILDEVDAPLDEPNIDRFGRIIQMMTGETQFIVITHSKRTMEMADVLYGVTMEEAGCSKLVSVKLATN